MVPISWAYRMYVGRVKDSIESQLEWWTNILVNSWVPLHKYQSALKTLFNFVEDPLKIVEFCFLCYYDDYDQMDKT